MRVAPIPTSWPDVVDNALGLIFLALLFFGAGYFVYRMDPPR